MILHGFPLINDIKYLDSRYQWRCQQRCKTGVRFCWMELKQNVKTHQPDWRRWSTEGRTLVHPRGQGDSCTQGNVADWLATHPGVHLGSRPTTW